MKKMLFNGYVVTFMIIVAFFSIVTNVYAANFKYSDFNWEELLEQNRDYWISGCDTGDENCYDRIIKTQKGFYERMYKILAHYQDRENLTIDDKIIIETAFYGITPDSFRDPLEGEDNPYNIGDDAYSSYIGSNSTSDGADDYFRNEEDSLKTLINNMVAYKEPCYGISSEKPQIVNDVATCSGEYKPDGERCVVLLDDLKTTYLDGILRNIPIIGFFKNDNKKKCEELADGYYDYELGKISKKPEIDEELYWEFLINSNYFDKKEHLNSYFQSVLKKTNHTSMTELNETEYKENEKMIKLARKSIVNNIKSVLETYEPFSSDVSMTSGKSYSYWWPIGSVEVTEENGKLMASGEPEAIGISSKFGLRTHPISGKVNSMHYGIDIGGVENSTNIIAAKNGTVISIIDDEGGKCVNGDKDCGGGYGNFVILQHDDGNYTIYAHLANGTLSIKNGDVVSQGQVLAKMGTTGSSTGAHLHFEVRVGGNDTASAQDPLIYVSPDNPRGGVGEIIIPEEYGNSGFYTYTELLTINWGYDQKKVYDIWKKSGAKSEDYIAMLNGRYLIACTTTYGNVGDYIDFYLADGTKIETIMLDAKSQEYTSYDHNPANKWGHNDGQQIIEFEITHNPNGSGDVSTWANTEAWHGKRVAGATNLGKNVIKENQ